MKSDRLAKNKNKGTKVTIDPLCEHALIFEASSRKAHKVVSLTSPSQRHTPYQSITPRRVPYLQFVIPCCPVVCAVIFNTAVVQEHHFECCVHGGVGGEVAADGRPDFISDRDVYVPTPSRGRRAGGAVDGRHRPYEAYNLKVPDADACRVLVCKADVVLHEAPDRSCDRRRPQASRQDNLHEGWDDVITRQEPQRKRVRLRERQWVRWELISRPEDQ